MGGPTGLRGLGQLLLGHSWPCSWPCCTGGAYPSELPRPSLPCICTLSWGTSSPSHGASPTYLVPFVGLVEAGSERSHRPQAWLETLHHRLSPGWQYFCPSSCTLQLPHHPQLFGPWAAPELLSSSSLQFGLSPLPSGGGASSRPYSSLPKPTDQELPLEGTRRWQCLPSCSGPWQLTADVWGGGPTGPCSLTPVAQPEAVTLESTRVTSGPLPLGSSIHTRQGGEEVQRFLWTVGRPEDTLWSPFPASSSPSPLSLPLGPHPYEGWGGNLWGRAQDKVWISAPPLPGLCGLGQ